MSVSGNQRGRGGTVVSVPGEHWEVGGQRGMEKAGEVDLSHADHSA